MPCVNASTAVLDQSALHSNKIPIFFCSNNAKIQYDDYASIYVFKHFHLIERFVC